MNEVGYLLKKQPEISFLLNHFLIDNPIINPHKLKRAILELLNTIIH